jgi:ribose transport system substrate-binding protein
MKKSIGLVAILLASSAMNVATAAQPEWLTGKLKKPIEETVIGFTNLGVGVNAYTAEYQRVFDLYAKELGVKMIVLDSGTDPAKQGSQVQDLMTQKVDGLIIWPVNASAIVPFVKKAHEENFPIVITNSDVDPSGREFYNTFTGPDHFTQAQIAGKMMVDALGGKGDVVLINGLPGYDVSKLRVDGFMDAIKGTEIKVLDSQPGDWSQEKGQTVMENYITRFGAEIDGVYSADCGMGMGAYAAIEAGIADGRLKEGQIKQTDPTVYQPCYDGIKAGTYYGSVIQSPGEDAKLAIRTMLQILAGQSVAKNVYMETPAITAANVGTFERPNY